MPTRAFFIMWSDAFSALGSCHRVSGADGNQLTRLSCSDLCVSLPRKTGSAMRVSLSWSRFFALFPRLPGVALPALSVLCLSFLLLSALLPVSLSQRVPIRKACVHAHQNCTQQHSVLAQHAFLTWHLDEIRCQL